MMAVQTQAHALTNLTFYDFNTTFTNLTDGELFFIRINMMKGNASDSLFTTLDTGCLTRVNKLLFEVISFHFVSRMTRFTFTSQIN